MRAALNAGRVQFLVLGAFMGGWGAHEIGRAHV